ncbi:Prophage integrase IntA [Sphingomonas sp. S2M10]|uniref:tyrosine-type recombinase/integrase n=1 Tax=Sphingomonas sp. S2M10 TaxID=2705010 RepID=UPI001456BB8B|nr:integrase arm-type DNA-binding domain-containing protein [Sphingomonas sp. S2M10]NLS28137.1 Prophage integrase IntA [Sphingomonas sp. S2M10]
MLTDAKCRAAKATGKAYKLSDARGLYLFVTASGYRSWRWKYRLRGKEQKLVLGSYPDMSLSKARDSRDAASLMLREGSDPSLMKKRGAPIGTPTLKQLAEEWIEQQKVTWVERHAQDVQRSLERDVYPHLGEVLITEITPPDILRLLRAIEARPAIETAHRVCQRLDAVFAFGIACARATSNPAAEVHGALRPVKRGRQPALRSIDEARQLLIESEKQPGQPLVKIASRLLALTAVRPGVIRLAQPHELEDLDGAEPIWRVPAEKMKLSLERKEDPAFEFIVPLAPQAVALFKLATRLTRPGPYLFPNLRHAHRPMSDAAIGTMYNRLSEFRGRHVPHGWRSTFSTTMNELAEREGRPGDQAVIDLMLAHKPKGVEFAYNRAAYMPRRREIARLWADLLLEGLAPAETLLDLPRR